MDKRIAEIAVKINIVARIKFSGNLKNLSSSFDIILVQNDIRHFKKVPEN
jgi:hypothetical protein